MSGATAMLGIILALNGCTDQPTRPGGELPGPDPVNLGLMEITLSGLTSQSGMGASARGVTPDALSAGSSDGEAMAASLNLAVVEDGERTGLQMEPVAYASFTHGERGAGGQRYLSATFRVRNASAGGVAYSGGINNVALVAVATSSTINETPVSRMLRFDGSNASASLATELRPTGAVAIGDDGELTAPTTDVLQAFTEAEAGALAASAGLANVFPYGFTVRNPRRHTDRRLAGNPAEDQFDGVVTLAFRVPLVADPADDPFELSVMVLAVSDPETRITQSFEGQMSCPDLIESKADKLRAAVTLLPGGAYAGIRPTRDIAQLRTAGTAVAPIAHLPDAVTGSYPPPPIMVDLSGSTGVVPIIWDIVPSPDPNAAPREYRARFGYYNPSSAHVMHPIGPDNFFVPGTARRNQPVEFQPGLHVPPNGGFEVTFNAALTPVLNWSLGNQFVSADVTDPDSLPTPPKCGFRF